MVEPCPHLYVKTTVPCGLEEGLVAQGICEACGDDVERMFKPQGPTLLELFGEPDRDGWSPWSEQ